MEDHFERLLNVEQATNSSSSVALNAVKFIESSKYTGLRKGYVFKLGDEGLGYYLDKGDNRFVSDGEELDEEESGRAKKRKHGGEDGKYVSIFHVFIEV